MLPRINKFLFFSILLLSIGLGSTYIYFKNYSWREFSKPEEMEFNGDLINKQAPLSSNFYKVYDKLYPGAREYSMTDQIISEFISGLTGTRRIHECKCDDIGYTAWNNDNFDFKFNLKKQLGNYRQFGYGLEKFSSPQKCFDFWINHEILLRKGYLKNLDELSNMIFDKNVKELSDDEIINLIVYRQLENRAFHDTIELTRRINTLKVQYKE